MGCACRGAIELNVSQPVELIVGIADIVAVGVSGLDSVAVGIELRWLIVVDKLRYEISINYLSSMSPNTL